MTLNTSDVAKVSPTSASQTRSAPPVDAPRPPRSSSATRARPEKLELGAAAFDRNVVPPARPRVVEQPRERRGAARSASERPAERRRDGDYEREKLRYKPSRERLFGAVEEHEGAADVGARLAREQQVAPGREEHRTRVSFGVGRGGRGREHAIPEEAEEDEVIDDGPGVRRSGTSDGSGRSGHAVGGVVDGLKSLRVKVHYPEETRFIIIQATSSFTQFADQIVRKFGGRMDGKAMKIKTKDDDGDLITIGDQDDLDPCLLSARQKARGEGSDVGKLEASTPTKCNIKIFEANKGCRSGYRLKLWRHTDLWRLHLIMFHDD